MIIKVHSDEQTLIRLLRWNDPYVAGALLGKTIKAIETNNQRGAMWTWIKNWKITIPKGTFDVVLPRYNPQKKTIPKVLIPPMVNQPEEWAIQFYRRNEEENDQY